MWGLRRVWNRVYRGCDGFRYPGGDITPARSLPKARRNADFLFRLSRLDIVSISIPRETDERNWSGYPGIPADAIHERARHESALSLLLESYTPSVIHRPSLQPSLQPSLLIGLSVGGISQTSFSERRDFRSRRASSFDPATINHTGQCNCVVMT
ncbi:hypothetical protein HN011_008940 [Eciton burchellii]|nr:hypothetical protein HN011_008940 [Eciton burchellii]